MMEGGGYFETHWEPGGEFTASELLIGPPDPGWVPPVSHGLCQRCREVKRKDFFPADATYSLGETNECLECEWRRLVGERKGRLRNARRRSIDRAIRRDWPEYARQRDRDRRVKRKTSGSHTTVDLCLQWVHQGGVCAYCRVHLTSANAAVDHVDPISLGGSDGPENLVWSCRTCNLKKGGKAPEEWRNCPRWPPLWPIGTQFWESAAPGPNPSPTKETP